MFVRRSLRLNPNYSPNSSPNKVDNNSAEYFMQENPIQFKREEAAAESSKERYFNSPIIQTITNKDKDSEVKSEQKIEADVEMIDEKPKVTSATVKAINKMNFFNKKKKSGKISGGLKKKILNGKLAKLLTPKSALILLHELNPNCVCKVQEQPGCIPPSFVAQVSYNDEVLGTGQGLSKAHAKNTAAENAIRAIVSKTMLNQTRKPGNETNSEGINKEKMAYTPENLPWAGLASFAIYKMFSEWQAQGTDLLTVSAVKPKTKSPTIPNPVAKKDLPPNAVELHPAVVLNMMCPGLTAVEVEREDGPKCRVKMAYSVDGKMFTGVGGNKKDAKKEAAKAVLEGLYGLSYPQ